MRRVASSLICTNGKLDIGIDIDTDFGIEIGIDIDIDIDMKCVTRNSTPAP